jgi:NAD(P)H-hydrate epimerase
MARIDRITIDERHLPGVLLMEHAGQQVVRVLARRAGGLAGRRILVVAGGGNNGGDGFVIARLLSGRGAHVRAVCLKNDADGYRGDARVNLDALVGMRVPTAFATTAAELDAAFAAARAQEADVVVDAVLGTGAHGRLSDLVTEAVRRINALDRPVMAVDLPTGVNADTGQVEGEAVRARWTVTMGLPKPGFFHPPGSRLAGELWVADLGFPADLTGDPGLSFSLSLAGELAGRLSPRGPVSHKGDQGRVLVVGGSRGMTGAAVMAARSALKAGAGLVRLLLPASTWPAAAAAAPEILVFPAAETADGALAASAANAVAEHVADCDVLLLGPGIGRADETVALVRDVCAATRLPTVLDADGLRAVPPVHAFEGRDVVLTPHMAEAAHLLGSTAADVARDRYAALAALVATRRCHVILKGPWTLIGGPGERPRINPSGNAGLATAGTGDVLAGTVAGLMAVREGRRRSSGRDPGAAQPVEPLAETVALAVYLHGLSADLAVRALATDRITAPDVLAHLTPALARMARARRGRRIRSDRVRWL